MTWLLAEASAAFWHTWTYWKPVYIVTGWGLVLIGLLLLTDLAWRAL